MGKSAPDPASMVAAQAQANSAAVKESARVNAVDIYGPYGQTLYARNPDGTPRAQVTSLSDVGQGIFDQTTDIAGELLGQARNSINYLPDQPFTMDGMPYDPRAFDTGQLPQFDASGLPYDPRAYGDINQYVDSAGDAVFNQYKARLEPQYEQQTRRLEQRLADTGHAMGGEGYNKAQDELRRSQNEGWQAAANAATTAAGSEAQRRLGMEQGLRTTGFQETQVTDKQIMADLLQKFQTEQGIRSQLTQEELMKRTQDFNEASAYIQGSPVMGQPQAPKMPAYNVQSPDVIGATMGAAGMQNAQTGSMWQGAANLGASMGGKGAGATGASMATGEAANAAGKMMMMSSRAFKHDDGAAERILDRVKRLPIRTWRYRPQIEPSQPLHIGPYAEDWTEHLGLGSGREISMIDAVGVCLQCIKELADEVSALNQRLGAA